MSGRAVGRESGEGKKESVRERGERKPRENVREEGKREREE